MLHTLVSLIVALEPDPHRLCSFTSRLRIHSLGELLPYLACLLAVGRALESPEFTDLPFHQASPAEQVARRRLRNPFNPLREVDQALANLRREVGALDVALQQTDGSDPALDAGIELLARSIRTDSEDAARLSTFLEKHS